MGKKTNLIQLGGNEELSFSNILYEKFDILFFSMKTPQDILNLENTLLEDGELKQLYRFSVFLIGQQSYAYMMPQFLNILPANRIIYSKDEHLGEKILENLNWKNADPVNFSNMDTLSTYINDTYFSGQDGSRIRYEQIEISSTVTEHSSLYGRGEIAIKNIKFINLTQVIRVRMTMALPPNMNMELYPEVGFEGEGQIVFKITILNEQGSKVMKSYELSDISEGLQFRTEEVSTIMFVSIFLKGEVTSFKLRNIHIRRIRPNHGTYMVNSKLITDNDSNGQIAIYFDSGDRKPPLNVYFSGWRTAEGFEGGGMMTNIGKGSPYLLIADERLEGGAFYVGNSVFEKKVINEIRTYMKILHFSNEQLILSGISMGTTAALYYAATLEPAAVIVGKPLIHLGNMAYKERLERPYGFSTSLDLLLLNEHRTDNRAQNNFDNKFWEMFKKGNFKNTIFAIAFMYQDDYDNKAFKELFSFLKSKYPFSRILYKGLTGRHNDDTPGITNWFIMQYQKILETKFNRRGNNE